MGRSPFSNCKRCWHCQQQQQQNISSSSSNHNTLRMYAASCAVVSQSKLSETSFTGSYLPRSKPQTPLASQPQTPSNQPFSHHNNKPVSTLHRQGFSQGSNLMEWDKIWAINVQVIDPVAPRYWCIADTPHPWLTSLSGEGAPAADEFRSVALHKKNEACGSKVRL